MTNPTLERAARALEAAHIECAKASGNPIEGGEDYVAMARAVLMAVLPTLERYDSDYAGQYKDERGDYVLYADLQAILNDGEGDKPPLTD